MRAKQVYSEFCQLLDREKKRKNKKKKTRNKNKMIEKLYA